MNRTHIYNGKLYTLAASTRDFREKREPKMVAEIVSPLLEEVDRNYLKLRELMEKDK